MRKKNFVFYLDFKLFFNMHFKLKIPNNNNNNNSTTM